MQPLLTSAESDRPVSFAAPESDETFAILYRQISPRLRRYLRVAEPEEADDLAADVWLAIVGLLGRFRGNESGFQALVFTIARRRITDHRRRRGRRRTDVVANDGLVDHAGLEHPEAQVVGSLGTRAAVDEVVRCLPRAQADVVLLRVIGGLAVEDVAEILERSPGAVRILQHRALKRLRDDPTAVDLKRRLAG